MAKPGAWALHVTLAAETDANMVFTNQPLADTFLFSSHRHVMLVDLEGMTSVRFVVNKQSTAANAGATLRLVYSTSFSTSVGSYADIGVTPVETGIDVANQVLSTDWIDLVEEAKRDVYIAVIGAGGNGTIDPAFGVIGASFQ